MVGRLGLPRLSCFNDLCCRTRRSWPGSPRGSRNLVSNQTHAAKGGSQRLRYVKTYVDRHGVRRCYFRKKGFAEVPLRGRPGTKEFRASYDRAVAECARVQIPDGFLYAIRVRGFALVKVGYSTAPARRLAELENGAQMGGGLELLGQIPGTQQHERGLHRRFARHRAFGEWFRLEGEVLEWTTALARRASAA
jgi:hypothetical protein